MLACSGCMRVPPHGVVHAHSGTHERVGVTSRAQSSWRQRRCMSRGTHCTAHRARATIYEQRHKLACHDSWSQRSIRSSVLCGSPAYASEIVRRTVPVVGSDVVAVSEALTAGLRGDRLVLSSVHKSRLTFATAWLRLRKSPRATASLARSDAAQSEFGTRLGLL
jgi:hypothetical protein